MYNKALTSLSILFFMMGFITCLNDILVPYLKAVFALDYSQAALVQFCFFGAYGLTSMPASQLIARVGYQRGMVIGFCVSAVGCFMFYPAVHYHSYALFLLALFVLASGVVLLQVAANPFVSVMGAKEGASSRLTMVQAFNSFGTFLAPLFGAYFILSSLANSSDASYVVYAYLIIAIILVIIASAVDRLRFPPISIVADKKPSAWSSVIKDRVLLMGIFGIFTYVGAEVAIGSFLINYVMEQSIMQESEAAKMVSMYWGGAMVGRFLGVFSLKTFMPAKMLSIHALVAFVLILLSINSTGMLSLYSIVLVGFCNSIMFPTIFTLSIKGLKDGEEKTGSGLLATAILGGAIIPLFTGLLADKIGLQNALILPMFCYAYIALLGCIHISKSSQ